MRRLLHFVNESSLLHLTLALTATVFLFGLGFWGAASRGLLHFGYSTARPGFLDALYFSMVTISSLGYGDIRAEGWARILVGLEVVAGLSYFGLIVAKVSSIKQDYILRRMYGEAIDRKLARFVTQLDEQRTLYRTTAALLLDGDRSPHLTKVFQRDTPGSTFFSGYRQLLSDLTELMVYEASNHALFNLVDDSRLEATFDAIRGVLRRTTLIWAHDQKFARELVFAGSAEEIAHICDLAEKVAQLEMPSNTNGDVLRICGAIAELSGQIRSEILPSL